MLETSDLSATLRMIGEENLDVRTVTIGVNLNACASEDPARMCDAVKDRIRRAAGGLVPTANAVAARYGVQIVNKRLAITPASILLERHAGSRAASTASRRCSPRFAPRWNPSPPPAAFPRASFTKKSSAPPTRSARSATCWAPAPPFHATPDAHWMTAKEQRAAAKVFADYWEGKSCEKSVAERFRRYQPLVTAEKGGTA